MEKEFRRRRAEHARRSLDARIDLLDIGDHHQNDEGRRRHEIGEHDARHRAGQTGLIERRRQRNAIGDRRHEQRQQEQQRHEPLAGELAPRQHIGRRHADQARDQHDQADDFERHAEHVDQLKLAPGGHIPFEGPARREPGPQPAGRQRTRDHRADQRQQIDDEEGHDQPDAERPKPLRPGLRDHRFSPFRR